MCAIHGLFYNSKEDINKMIVKAHHRGPDGNGSWSDEHITLGHNLLSIVDTETKSKQPWIFEDLILVYNGEIYNYKQLQDELDYQFQTNTDTEVLAVGLKLQGIDFINKLDGMFAFACYNKTSKQLILARDSNGTKPVYYGYKDNKLCFSSEIKSLLEIGFKRKICKEALRHYYKQGLNTGYLTLFDGIKKLIPGEVKIINVITNSETSFNLNNINKIPLITNITNEKYIELQEETIDRLHQAVKMSLMGRRNIGLFLSGGLDSTSILYEMVKSDVQPNTFTTFFDLSIPDSKLNDDSLVAKKYCDELNVTNNQLHQNEKAYVDAMDNTFYALEEPRQGKSFPTYYNTNKFLSENNITVTLSGDGGDEVLSGYKHHKLPFWSTKLNSLGMHHRELNNTELNINLNEQVEYLNSWLPTGGLTNDSINNMLYTECLNTLCDDFFIRNDKLGMNFSMEGRFPFVLKVFRDFVRSIPGDVKSSDKHTHRFNPKYFFREAYRGKLPKYIVNKDKTGWRFPTDEILIGNKEYPGKNNSVLRQYIIETLKNKELQEIFEFDDDTVQNVYLNNKNYTPIPGSKFPPALLKQKELFTILNFAIWKKVFKMTI